MVSHHANTSIIQVLMSSRTTYIHDLCTLLKMHHRKPSRPGIGPKYQKAPERSTLLRGGTAPILDNLTPCFRNIYNVCFIYRHLILLKIFSKSSIYLYRIIDKIEIDSLTTFDAVRGQELC